MVAIPETVRVLLVEDHAPDARLAQLALAESRQATFEVACAHRLSDALARLSTETFDLILLDLGLPDSRGLDTFATIRDHSPDIPVVVLSALDDERLAEAAVRLGAQDYLVKDRDDERQIERSLRHARERQRWAPATRGANGSASGQPEHKAAGICAWCFRVRDDRGRWQTIESYLTAQKGGQISHGICPDCFDRTDLSRF